MNYILHLVVRDFRKKTPVQITRLRRLLTATAHSENQNGGCIQYNYKGFNKLLDKLSGKNTHKYVVI